MFDLDPVSWAALVAQLVRASVRSTECREFKPHLRQLIPHSQFFNSLRCLSFFQSQVLSCTCKSKIDLFVTKYTCIYIHHEPCVSLIAVGVLQAVLCYQTFFYTGDTLTVASQYEMFLLLLLLW